MDLFDILTLIGGLCMFLFGMNVMGQALERRAGNKLRLLLSKLTTGKMAGLLSGLAITALIQSSSATTVMVVGFVNSGLMTLKQAIHVIMGANIGTTVTAWILSLSGIESSNLFVRLLKPSSFTPILALIGIIFYLFSKNSKKKEVGTIFLGFAVLMSGMETMSGAVSQLSEIPAFQNLFILFENPLLGVCAGAVLTAIIQSSSASVGILQALSKTGQISWGSAIPIIMGQNIGTCVTAMISSIGANKNAKRAAFVHLLFNVIGAAFYLFLFCLIKAVIPLPILNESVSAFSLAVIHTFFNLCCTILILPFSKQLEKLVVKLIKEDQRVEIQSELDDRLLNTPAVALIQCNEIAADLAQNSIDILKNGLSLPNQYSESFAEEMRRKEKLTDQLEDLLNTYLVKLSSRQISEAEANNAAKLLKIIGDFERIADHGINLLDSFENLKMKDLSLSSEAKAEYDLLASAVSETLDHTLLAFLKEDLNEARQVEPLDQVIQCLKEKMRSNHIQRLQNHACSIESGFIYSDILTTLKRTSDHCSNIAGCILDLSESHLNLHESLYNFRNYSEDFRQSFMQYKRKYSLSE